MNTLNIMDMQFNYKAAIRGYESIVITRVWNGIGVMDLVIKDGVPNANLIQENDILWLDKEYHKAHIVERVETSMAGGEKSYKITALHANVLLQDYITVPPTGEESDAQAGTREEVAKAWVDSNCINPEDVNRKQYPIVLGGLVGLGEGISEKTRYKVLSEELSRIMDPEGLSWTLTMDPVNKVWAFNLQKGANKTSGQSINKRIMFGLKYGNLGEYRATKDLSSAKTVVYVGGTGEGSSRVVVEVDASGSGRRKEAFVDARDLTSEEALTERGVQVLAESLPIEGYEFIIIDRQFRYPDDYDLGDYVTIVIDKAKQEDRQIRKITEVYDVGNVSVTPEFGMLEMSLPDAIARIKSRVTSLETKETKFINDDDTAVDMSWSSSKITARISEEMSTHIAEVEWTAPTLGNSWVNFGSPHASAGYKRDVHGLVHIKGLIKSGTMNSAIFTLPEGYRPSEQLVFSVISNGAIGRLDVFVDGDVKLVSGSNAWVSLDSISFYANME